jgi:hypothetical protein
MVQSISVERTVDLPEYVGQTKGMSWPLVWPPKDPNDTNMDFSLDVSGWLLEIQDTVGSFVVGWTPNGAIGNLVITSAFSHNSIVTILTNGGVPYVTYTVNITITGVLTGEVLSRDIQLPVEPRFGNVVVTPSVSGVVS